MANGNGAQGAAFDPFPIFSAWRARGPLLGGVLLLCCATPLLSGLIGRLTGGRPWFEDAAAILCAGVRAEAYAVSETACHGMSAAPYVYAPWIARAAGEGVKAIGFHPMLLLYAAAFAGLAGLLLAATLWTPQGRPGLLLRAPLLTLWTGGAIAYGNVGVMLHALVFAAALAAPRLQGWALAAIVAAAAVKPTFALYAALFLFADRPLWRSALWAGAAAALGLAPTALTLLYDSPGAIAAWREALAYSAAHDNYGDGFLRWAMLVGLDARGALATALWAGFAAAMVACAAAVARRLDMGARERALFGVSALVLCSPRLMQYDVLGVGPGLAALLLALLARDPAWGRRASAFALAALASPLALQLFGWSDLAAAAPLLLLSLLVLALGAGWALPAAARNGRPAAPAGA